MIHLSKQQRERFSKGEMQGQESMEAATHFDHCETCLSSLLQEDSLFQLFLEEPAPAHPPDLEKAILAALNRVEASSYSLPNTAPLVGSREQNSEMDGLLDSGVEVALGVSFLFLSMILMGAEGLPMAWDSGIWMISAMEMSAGMLSAVLGSWVMVFVGIFSLIGLGFVWKMEELR